MKKKTNPAEKVEQWPIEKLVPYAKNSRIHSDEQVAQIAASIKEWGFTTAILVDETGGIIAGHGRLSAARKLGMAEVPVMVAAGWTEAQKRAYVIADNKLALNADWNNEMLRLELGELQDLNFNLDLIGFSTDELADLDLEVDSYDVLDGEDKYTKKVDAPIYKPEGPKPETTALCDKTQYLKLVQAVEAAQDIPEEERAFLIAAASRHIIFDFQAIAEYYAHSNEQIQALMEESALVIIDFDKAIQLGYVKLSKNMSEIYAQEKESEEHDEA